MVAAVALCVAVGAAFADSSIVVLALPQLLHRFRVSVEAISWVITAYNAVVAATALALVRLATPRWERLLLAAGVGLFLAGSAGCGASGALASLITLRCVQGLGGALLLVGSLPRLAVLVGSRRRAVELWAISGAVGAGIGPALGGALTELFDWRAIFVFQVPLAAAAVLGLGRSLPSEHEREHLTHPRERLGANIALGLVSGALVGALFLAVVLLIDGWLLSPITAAGIVSVIPASMLLVRRATAALPRRGTAATGVLALAGGLGGLALLPGASLLFALLSLALCGAGIGLAVPPLTSSSLDADALERSGALAIGIRHAGLVLALVALTPVLAGDLITAQAKATDRGASLVLHSNVSISTKVPLALDLARSLRSTNVEVPHFAPIFARHEKAGDRQQLQQLEHHLVGVVDAAVTRSTRRAFAISSLLAVLALLPLPLLPARDRGRRRPTHLALAAAVTASLVLASGELGRGAFTLGRVPRPHPCTEVVTMHSSGYLGYDTKLQEIALQGLDRAACHLNTTPVRLALSLQSAASRRRIAHGRNLQAVFRKSLQQGVDIQRKAGHLNAVDALLFRQLVTHTPLPLVKQILDI